MFHSNTKIDPDVGVTVESILRGSKQKFGGAQAGAAIVCFTIYYLHKL